MEKKVEKVTPQILGIFWQVEESGQGTKKYSIYVSFAPIPYFLCVHILKHAVIS